MKIAYLHGLDSNNVGPKNKWLKSIFTTFDPFIDYREKNIYQSIKTQVSDFNPDIIVGSSMGGYFAYLISKELNIKTLLFNPALHSRSYQPDMNGLEIGKFNPEMFFIFGKNDAIINPLKTVEIMKNEGKENFKILNYGHNTPIEDFINEILIITKNKD